MALAAMALLLIGVFRTKDSTAVMLGVAGDRA